MTESQRVPNNHNSNVLDRFAVPLDVRLQIAEAKQRMAESRYRLSVRRAQSLADKLSGTACTESIDNA
jgi:hypothetical protein